MSRSLLHTITAALAALATVNAGVVAPKQSAPGYSIQSFLINYNFETYPRGIRSQVPVADETIGDYDLLSWSTVLINQTQPPVAGVACHTAPTCTVVTEANALFTTLTDLSLSSLTAPQGVTAKYQYSPISYFDPYVFYYGCVVADANGAASLPASCNITANGLIGGKTVYSQTFQYKATGALLQQMTLGYFNQGWSGLKIDTLDFSVSDNLTQAALIDNLLATVYGPQNAAVLVDF